MKLSPIINAEDLANLNRENVVIVDAGSGGSAYEKYLEEHIDGALYVDLHNDLAQIPKDAKNGGRHPLPSLEKFAEVLHRLGINQNSHVIVYDNKNASIAGARFWWMLRSAGIEKVQVLNGGIQMAKEKGLPLNSKIVEPKIVDKISLKEWKLPTVAINFIEKHSENPDYLVIDVREKDRYDGKTEPIDDVAGHIPGAINIPFKENLNEDGTFKSPEVLHEKYAQVLKNIPSDKIAVHCGSGVTACHTLLALDYAEFKIPNLYVGSWSEWSRNDKPVARNK
ncbi:sulfurtransferase [Kaistella flava (ex Peng et al. 2021)]|uniref:Sulfurtransferase n=1 Tax=Kaistella flava (ex Peng et al. 2021) TaxID=2038776 RepID=A0A7M2Y9Z1_9FLAO|nr:sulfurtransferase [Kaistella flava (ex Peng et al. 2021)]QOW10916.1 sulfurtransferase [Kaistella flava (ex Peng et al. 2021)]